MEVFTGAYFVRLRCVARPGSKYLAADTDGRAVCLSGKRHVHNTVWAVAVAESPDGDGAPYVFLRGAYGRFLLPTLFNMDVGSCAGFEVQQEGFHELPIWHGFHWQAIRRGSSYILRSASGLYLRAHGKYRWSRKMVTATEDTGSSMLQWDIEDVPIRVARPRMTDPTRQLTHSRDEPPTQDQVTRTIMYIVGQPNGTFEPDQEEWAMVQVRSSNLMQLRVTLATRLGPAYPSDQNTLCIRGGPLGPVAPLLIDLPIGTDPIAIVIFTHGTPADNSFRYPDVEAPVQRRTFLRRLMGIFQN
ncbi:hypothetical protein ACP70R_034819 [Stipagrostis hirtigluma subsp. patula]